MHLIYRFILVSPFALFSLSAQSLINTETDIQKSNTCFGQMAKTYYLNQLNGFYPIHSRWVLIQRSIDKISTIITPEKSFDILDCRTYPKFNITLLKINGFFNKDQLIKVKKNNRSLNQHWVISLTHQFDFFPLSRTLHIIKKEETLAAFTKVTKIENNSLSFGHGSYDELYEFLFSEHHKTQLKKIENKIKKIAPSINNKKNISETLIEQYEDFKIQENLLNHHIEDYTLSHQRRLETLRKYFDLPEVFTGTPEASDFGAVLSTPFLHKSNYKFNLIGFLNNSSSRWYSQKQQSYAIDLTSDKIFNWIQQTIYEKDDLPCCIQ